jgi:O-methyltransferase
MALETNVMASVSDRNTAPVGSSDAVSLYIDLLKKCLTDMIYIDDPMSLMVPYRPIRLSERRRHALVRPLLAFLGANLQVVRPARQNFFDYSKLSKDEIREFRSKGMDWPPRAHTMIGLKRLDNLQYCVETALRDEIPGDFLETGVWRGGASILVKGILAVHGDRTRCVWLADSFRGLPPPDATKYPADRGWRLNESPELAISRDAVESHFRSYGLLDERVKFLEGWFKDTLPNAPIERLAVLRLDGDLYESTIQALDAMYAKLSPGGFLIVDDYSLAPCRKAVADFRRDRAIEEPIIDIDGMGAYWRKASASQAAGVPEPAP